MVHRPHNRAIPKNVDENQLPLDCPHPPTPRADSFESMDMWNRNIGVEGILDAQQNYFTNPVKT